MKRSVTHQSGASLRLAALQSAIVTSGPSVLLVCLFVYHLMLEVTSAGRHFPMDHCDTVTSVRLSHHTAKVGIASDRMRPQQFAVSINRLVAAVQRVDGRSDDGETGRGAEG